MTYVPPSSGGSSGSSPSSSSVSVGGSSTTNQTEATRVLLPLEIVRTTATTTALGGGAKSTQAITIKNPNIESVPAVILKDLLRDPSGNVIHGEEWILGTILPKEEISLGYDITFSKNATSGTYILSSTITRPHTIDLTFEANGMIFLEREVEALPAAPIIELEPIILRTVTEEDTTPSVAGVHTLAEKIIGSIVTETAYAESGENSPNGDQDPRERLKYMFVIVLVLLFMMTTYNRLSLIAKK